MSKPTAEGFVDEIKAKRAKYIELVKREEQYAARNPKGYRRKVRFLALLGYAYIIAILLVLVAVIALAILFFSAIGIKILVFAVPVAWVVIRSLYVKLDPPDGLEISREEAPELFREIDDVRTKLGAIRIDKVLLSAEINAFAAQVPRFGVLGPTKNYLCLGLPLLMYLRPDEARSVIAHEFGHFSGEHGKFGGWIYRLNRTWASIQQNLHRQGQGSSFFRAFFDWFEPKFDATSFALRRQNEYEADAAAVRIAGADAAARALMRYPVVVPHMQESFWNPLYERVRTDAAPPANVLSALPEVAKARFDFELAHPKIIAEINEETGYNNTHPSLGDRIRAMGVKSESDQTRLAVELTELMGESAAEAWFGDRLPRILERMDALQTQEMQPAWEHAHGQFKVMQKRLAELTEVKNGMPLTAREESEFAALTARLSGDDEGMAAFAAGLERFPNDPGLLAGYGQLLLDKDDPAGIECLERAAAAEPEFAADAYKVLYEFYIRTGDKEKAQEAEDRVLNAHILDAFASQQSANIAITDELAPHNLTSADVSRMQKELAECKHVGSAYLVQKVVVAGADRSFLVLFVFPRTVAGLMKTNHAQVVEEVSSKVTLDSRSYIYSPSESTAWIRRLKSIEHAEVYKR